VVCVGSGVCVSWGRQIKLQMMLWRRWYWTLWHARVWFTCEQLVPVSPSLRATPDGSMQQAEGSPCQSFSLGQQFLPSSSGIHKGCVADSIRGKCCMGRAVLGTQVF
jgi:hypothetical protein